MFIKNLEASDWRKLEYKHNTCEEAILYDEFAVGIYSSSRIEKEIIVGHLPIELSFLLCKFLSQEDCSLEFSPMGQTFLEDGLVVQGKYVAYSKSKRIIDILYKELDKKVARHKHMKIVVTEPSLKNIISFMQRKAM